jgi:hypothetical protein
MNWRHSTDEVYHVRHDWEGDGSLSRTVVDAIAAMQERNSESVEAADTMVNPDALDRLFEPLRGSPQRDADGRVEFTLDGYKVRVTWNGDVTVQRDSEDQNRGEIPTEEGFEVELARLIREAEANGVRVDGGWACKDDSEYPEWGIEIYEVAASR